MITKFKTYIFSKFPSYFKREDSYKDQNDQGLLERYCEAFGEELDETIVPDIENFLDLQDAQIAPSRFLTHLSDTLGNPPDIFKNEAQYRNILSFIVDYYKIKGTKKAYEFFFALLGFDVIIEELPEPEHFYDIGLTYDEDDTFDETELIYDTICPTCSGYCIEFIAVADNGNELTPIDEETIELLIEAIEFNEPINAILKKLTQSARLCDDVNTCIQEEITVSTFEVGNYDEALTYDNNEIYDTVSETQIEQITGESPYCSISRGDFNDDFNDDFLIN